ncbi:MAG: hypothetical protein MR384_01655 [Lachnospiraceae bacterium]|nr:hypothetical protein [Lachnospiraceae bacterium]
MRKKLIALALAVAISATGCGVVDLSDENKNIIAEYMAGELLKYNKDYSGTIEYDRSVLEPTPTPEPTVAPNKPAATPKPLDQGDSQEPAVGESDDGTGETNTEVSLSELYGTNGIKVKHTTYTSGRSYGSDYSTIAANPGKKLIVVYFNIKNTSSKTTRLNLSDKSVTYELYKNDKSYGEPLLTIAKGDMQYFNEKLKAGQNRQGVLIFETDSSFKAKGAVIKAVKGGKEADILLK